MHNILDNLKCIVFTAFIYVFNFSLFFTAEKQNMQIISIFKFQYDRMIHSGYNTSNVLKFSNPKWKNT